MENSLSEQILKVLENNSRLTNQEIAIMLGVSEEKVHMEKGYICSGRDAWKIIILSFCIRSP